MIRAIVSYLSGSIFVLFSQNIIAQTDIQSLSLDRFARAEQFHSCQERLLKVAEIFKEQTGKEVITTYCEESTISDGSLSGLIKYLSSEPVEYGNVMSVYGDGLDNYGLYHSIERCNEPTEVARQEDIFEESTGLKVLTSYCYQISSVRPIWARYIEGIGTSTTKKHISSIDVYGSINSGDLPLFEYLYNKLSAMELVKNVADISIAHGGTGHQIRIDYYADQRIYLDSNIKLKYENASQCLKALNQLQKATVTIDSIVGSYCELNNGLNGNRLVALSASNEIADFESSLKYEKFKGGFSSRSACESNIEVMWKKLEEYGMKPVMLSCSFNYRKFDLVGFLKP